MGNPVAEWSLSLDIECPKCDHYFDLCNEDEFWHRGIAPCESKEGVEVECPKCEHQFKCEVQY